MTSILKIYRIREARLDLFLAMLATALMIWFFSDIFVSIILENLSTYTSAFATLLGFLLAAYALLLAFPKSGYLEAISHHENYGKIYKYFIFSLYMTLLLLILSFLGNYLWYNPEILYCYAVVFLFVQIYSLVLIFRVISLLYSMTEALFRK